MEGVGLLTSIPNELFIQPFYDFAKLGIRGYTTGKITQDDINNFLFTSGGDKGTIFEAFNTNETAFGKKYGDAALLTARFLDFAPELINVPFTQAGKATKFQKFASEVKVAGQGAEEVAPKVSRFKQIGEAIKNFETKLGQTLSPSAKQEIQKAVQNPISFLERLRKAETELIKKTPTFGEPAKQLKGVGMEYSAIKRAIEKNPTETEIADEAKRLNSL